MLNTQKLQNLKSKGDKHVAACPACRENNGDSKGEHLVIYHGKEGPFDGPFECIANQGDHPHRQRIFDLVGIKDTLPPLSPNQRQQFKRKQSQEALEKRRKEQKLQRCQAEIDEKLKGFLSESWRQELIDSSPITPDEPRFARCDLLESLFSLSSVVWLGDTPDSGKKRHREHFKTLKEWTRLARPKGFLYPRFAAGVFKPDSFSRCQKNVIKCDFILVEGDELIGNTPETPEEKELNKAKCAALIKFLCSEGFSLRAVVDTGNKSLHAFFDRPPKKELEALKELAPSLGIDAGPIERCSFYPLRLPGAVHEKSGKEASLLYLKGKESTK